MARLPAALAALAVAVAACIGAACAQEFDQNGCIKAGTFNPKINYFSRAFAGQAFTGTAANTYSFSVRYYNYYKVVTDKNSKASYLLYQCGAPKPTTDYISFSIPLRAYRLANTDDIPANYLQMLGAISALKFAPAGTVVDSCLQKWVQTSASKPASTILPVFLSYFFSTDYKGSNISFTAAGDFTPLRRAEWIKYISTFFNLETRANNLFNQIQTAYSCTSNKALKAITSKPVIVWVNFYGGTWTLSAAAYKLKFVLDAGGNNPVQVGGGADVMYDMSSSQQAASFRALLKTVTLVLDETYQPTGPPGYSLTTFLTNAGITQAQSASYPALKNKNVWSIYGLYETKNFATAWYEGAISQPQVVLQEIVHMLKPSLYPKTFAHTYFYNVASAKGVATSAAKCTAKDPSAAIAPAGLAC